ncbi:MAG: DUF47 family protein [Candidatus Bathyarchaeia archaeon]
MSWLIPREKKFFDMLEMEVDGVVKGAQILCNLTCDYSNLSKAFKEIAEIEHQTDDIVHNIFGELNLTFITPIDREDISSLASTLDDVIDYIYGAVMRLHSYNVKNIPKMMASLAEVLLKASVELGHMVRKLRELKNPREIELRCIEVNRLENEADLIVNKGIVELFETEDVKEIIKLKEIYEFMEEAVDKCEDVTDIVCDIIMKTR